MLVGYNHNIRYRGDVFHVQTEDSGINNPHIITLLYRGGTILASKKTSYADILKIENLELVIEELMKDQHKDMLRRLKAGEFDGRAFPGLAPDTAAPPKEELQQSSPPAETEPPAATPIAGAAPPQRRADIIQQGGRASTLDEIILDYLLTDDTER